MRAKFFDTPAHVAYASPRGWLHRTLPAQQPTEPWLDIKGAAVSLNLKPVEYLVMLKEEYAELRRSPLCVRKAINCCALSNALPEIIFAEYGSTEPHKVHGTKCHGDYRKHLRRECEAHHTVRDICDFSKHGPQLRRETQKGPSAVSVSSVKPIRRMEGIYQGLLALMNHREVERLMIEHKNGRRELMDDVLGHVIASWNVIFARDGL